MKIVAMSRKAGRDYSFPRRCIVIDIFALVSGEQPVGLAPSETIRAVLPIEFHEWSRRDLDLVRGGELRCRVRRRDLFTGRHAETILRFVAQYRAEVEEVVVICQGGLQRSGAVRDALSVLFGCSSPVIKRPRRITRLILRVARRLESDI